MGGYLVRRWSSSAAGIHIPATFSPHERNIVAKTATVATAVATAVERTPQRSGEQKDGGAVCYGPRLRLRARHMRLPIDFIKRRLRSTYKMVGAASIWNYDVRKYVRRFVPESRIELREIESLPVKTHSVMLYAIFAEYNQIIARI